MLQPRAANVVLVVQPAPHEVRQPMRGGAAAMRRATRRGLHAAVAQHVAAERRTAAIGLDQAAEMVRPERQQIVAMARRIDDDFLSADEGDGAPVAKRGR